MNARIISHRDLDVYKRAMAALVSAMRICRRFPPAEKYELAAQLRASARSVCSCIAEAWRKRNYPAAFASKLTDAEAEAAESQTWADIALLEGYISQSEADGLVSEYEVVLGQLVKLRLSANKWKKC
ncbi:MAG TPA: four helix bundle protein [Longimicrobiales bacterium]